MDRPSLLPLRKASAWWESVQFLGVSSHVYRSSFLEVIRLPN